MLHPPIALILLFLNATLLAGAGEALADDMFASIANQAVRSSVAERFPGYLIWSVKVTGGGDKEEYEIAVFDPHSPSHHAERLNDSPLYVRTTYKIVVSESGKVVSEDPHAIPEEAVPTEALATYREWRQGRPTGMIVAWGAYQEPNEERLYVANIIVNAVESHILIVNQSGAIIRDSDLESEDAG